MSNEPDRKVAASIEVAASEEAVWRALTNAEELTRWFPPFARVTDPGLGGKIWLSWGEGMEGESVIEIWEPNRHLRVVEASGMAVDYIITKGGSGSVLRIVHSGFGAGAEWDDMIDSVEGGWAYFLYNLKHYLERHAGKVRHMISTRRQMAIPRAGAWPLLLGEQGFALNAPALTEGNPYTAQIGDRKVSGRIFVCRPERNFGGTIRELDDGVLFVELEAGSPWHCGVWLSVYGADVKVDELQRELQRTMDQVVSP